MRGFAGRVVIGLVALAALRCAPVESMQAPDWATNSTSTDSAPFDPDAADFANVRFPTPLGLAQAKAIMTLTSTFAVNIGDAAFPPRHVYAFNVILDSPDAREIFETILVTGSPAGKLYALAAFSLLDPDRYHQTAATLRQEIAEVRTIDGCLYETQPLSTLVRKIEHSHLGQQFR